MAKTETMTIEDAITFPCPCGGKVIVAGHEAVLHSMPYCVDFEKKEPHDFVKMCRLHIESLEAKS